MLGDFFWLIPFTAKSFHFQEPGRDFVDLLDLVAAGARDAAVEFRQTQTPKGERKPCRRSGFERSCHPADSEFGVSI